MQRSKVIYTTNSVESVNSQLRKVTNNKRVFPSDSAVFKSLYLTIDYMTKKWTIVIPIGLGDKEHNYCKLSFPRRRESRYLLSQV